MQCCDTRRSLFPRLASLRRTRVLQAVKHHSLQEHRWPKDSFAKSWTLHGQHISQIFAVEVFAGTARLTARLRSLGLVDSVGIDCSMPTRLNGPIIKLDLLQPTHLHLVIDGPISNRACQFVHCAPPCGTASRARLIQRSNRPMPPPLRDDDHPNGLPWLTPDQKGRVAKANDLYSTTCQLIKLCCEKGILWSCDSPGRSFMWQTTPFVDLFSTIQCMSTEMHHCMFGSSSKKKPTKLIHNIDSFHHLDQLCDNQHEHELWEQKPDGAWATAEETAYPWPLARAMATQVVLQTSNERC